MPHTINPVTTIVHMIGQCSRGSFLVAGIICRYAVHEITRSMVILRG